MTALPTPRHPLLDPLWRATIKDVPYARAFVDLAGGGFENDHIALRTLARDGEGSGIAVFRGVFERLGWQVREHYVFADVHLRALYLAQPGLPRVFISELDVTALPAEAQRVLRAAPRDPPPPPLSMFTVAEFAALAAWFRAPPPPDRAAVDVVARHSQYGAWLLCFGRRVNHFTAVVDDVAAWQARMTAAGIPMKKDIEGDVIPAGGRGLRQTATAANDVDVVFADGTRAPRPYAYFEIAERKGGFDGFLAQQARQLFDQTQLPR
jgi:hypothetical protein